MFTEARQDLAAVLATVPGVKGYEFRPPAPKAGDAWPLLTVADRGRARNFEGSWRIMLALGQDERTATRLLDDLLPELVDLVDPVAYVEQVIPVTINTEAGEAFAAEIRVRRE